MAERRMFTKKVTDDDNFMSLSSSAQALYLHLSMNADDDGFCNQVSVSMFKAHASVQDLQALLEKRYIYQFENGVIVIKHWRMANALRKDRYTPTAFQEELAKLDIKDNGSYTLKNDDSDVWLPDGCQLVATGKDSIDKDRLDKNNISSSLHSVVDAWNSLSEYGIKPISKLTVGTKRYDSLVARLKKYGLDDVIKAIENIKHSDFLQGNTGDWFITFDWFVKPNNFPKVLEGNYNNTNPKPQQTSTDLDPQITAQLRALEERQNETLAEFDNLTDEEIDRMCRGEL